MINMDRKPVIRIFLESHAPQLLDISSQIISEIFTNDAEKVIGPIRLPTRIRRYCILRSPHVDKDSREHLEIRSYKRFFDIHLLVDLADLELDLPPGVSLSFAYNS